MSLALEWKIISDPRLGEERRLREERRRREQALRKERERARRSKLLFAAFTVVAGLVSGILLAAIVLHVGVVQNEVRLREARREIELERRRQDALRLEIASLESPGRIEGEAAGRLGMVQMEKVEYLETPAYRVAVERRIREREEAVSQVQAMAEDPGEGGM
ncbi:MAG: hypothetical protein ACUVRX_04995 [Actinomycetota bacterium]